MINTATKNQAEKADYRNFRNQQFFRLLSILFFSSVITSFVLVEMYFQITDIWSSNDLPVYFSPEASEQLNSTYPTLTSSLGKWLAIMLALNAVLLGVAGGFITYRLAKPLYAVNLAVKAIGDGKLHTDLQLGKSADLHSLAESINSAVTKIQLMVMTLQQEIQHFETIAEKQPPSEELTQLLENSKIALEYFETVEIVDAETSESG